MRRALVAIGLVLAVAAVALVSTVRGGLGTEVAADPSGASDEHGSAIPGSAPSIGSARASGEEPGAPELAWRAPREGERGPDIPLETAEPIAQLNVEVATLDARLAVARASGADPAEIGALEAERADAIRRRDALTAPEAGPPPA